MGAQLTNLAEVLEDTLKTNQERAAKLAQEQDREWQQLARGRHGIKRMEPQLKPPNHALVARAIGDQQKEFKARLENRKKSFVKMTIVFTMKLILIKIYS